ncbi:MAG: phosphate ABC transporter substrate-binding protein [Pseudomonadota bacterium]
MRHLTWIKIGLGLFACALLLSVHPLGAVAEAPNGLLLSGSSTMGPLMRDIASRYQLTHPGFTVEVRMGGTGSGIDDTRRGMASLGMVSRPLGAGEHDLYGVPVARDGVALIVHRDNPVGDLSAAQIAELYSGKVANWRALGGRDRPVHLLAGPAAAGSAEPFSHYIGLPYASFAAHRTIGPNAARIDAVAADPDAVVFVSIGDAERRAQAGAPIRLLAVGGVTASSKNVRNGNYPMARPLMLISHGAPSGAAREFVEFCLSSQVTDLIVKFDFVPYLD